MRALLLNWALSASALTAAVLLLRAAFGRRIGARLRYALWLAVLARLLAPGQLYAAPVEVPRVLPEALTVQTLPAPRRHPEAEKTLPVPKEGTPVPGGAEAASGPSATRRTLDWWAALGGVWLAGSTAMAAAFLVSNARFAGRLRRVRAPLAADCPLRVYTAPGLPSPCLFGVLRPAVYVTPEAAADPVVLRHVLAHEATHYRHGDHIWAPLRCAALAVHWWNPLVWLAAVLSRRDAELACDEGTLKILGDGERRAYGGTLLALVTAKSGPGDLLRCATTMTGTKRNLRERVGRIARAPKRWLWAAVLSAALAALVCACSFARPETSKADGPLTAEELERFNTEVFNGEGFNIRNQLLFLAVEAPKDYKQIDLFQLFYNGTGEPMEVTEAERQAVADAVLYGQDLELDLIKCPASEMDAVLREYVGLSLDETDKRGLDLFTYLKEYDAYYSFHSDTNYPGQVTFTSGERKDGKVLLYYEGESFPVLVSDGGEMSTRSFGPVCVTLEPREDGGCRFLSNWFLAWSGGLPASPTAYPAWDPELVIPLDGLAPYEPETVTVERRADDVAESLYRTRFEPDEFSGEGFEVEVYRSADGSVQASVVVSETERDCFLTIPAEYSAGWTAEDSAEVFTHLFGRSGVMLCYFGQFGENHYGTITDYYAFDDHDAPSLLLRALGDAQTLDLDGDGVLEVASSYGGSQLFFQRDGVLYAADAAELLHQAWPESGYLNCGLWDPESRSLSFSIEVPLEGTDVTVSAFRTLFFDGENLLVYKDESGYTNRVANGLEALPQEVVRQAALLADTSLQDLKASGYGWDGSGRYDEGNAGPENVVWDDWRVTGIGGPWYETVRGLRVEIWNVDYETHTTTPGRVMLAGGSYMGEDGWCMIGYPGCDYLYFELDEDGSRTFLFSIMENDCAPGSELFREDLTRALEAEGLLPPGED